MTIALMLLAPLLEARQSSANLSVGATVIEYTRIATLAQQPDFLVTAADVRRGYIELPVASVMSIRSNRKFGHRLVIESVETAFANLQVSIAGANPVDMKGRASIALTAHDGEAVYRLNYRIFLSPEVTPGRYGWPYRLYVETI